MWFYILILVVILYYTGLYEKLPSPFHSLFSSLDNVLPGELITDDLEGIYESENTKLNTTYFIIGKDGTNLIYLKSKTHLSDTDDYKKFKDKQISVLQKNVFTDQDKKEIRKINNVYQIDDIELKRKDGKLLLIKNEETTAYIKIKNMI